MYQKLWIPISLARFQPGGLSAIEVTAMMRIQGRIVLILAAVFQTVFPIRHQDIRQDQVCRNSLYKGQSLLTRNWRYRPADTDHCFLCTARKSCLCHISVVYNDHVLFFAKFRFSFLEILCLIQRPGRWIFPYCHVLLQ